MSLLNKVIDGSNKRRRITDRKTEVYAPPIVSLLNEVIDDNIKKRSIDGGAEVYVLSTASSLNSL